MELPKAYDPAATESRIYQLWEESGFFNPDNLPGDRPKAFSVVMPPPNATGVLHIGHAAGLTIQDIIIRYKRMRGFKTLWLPGTDHAAIATQAVVEKNISKKEGKTRHDLGREELVRRIESFVEEHRHIIASQTKVFGASCDWSREAFTLDEPRSFAVRTMFKKMHDDGLIYRGNRIVNWDPKGQTTISDDEIVYEERAAKLYTFRYSKDFPISIATTRPETKVGDTGVAVHPDDERYRHYVGKEYDVEFCGVLLHITVVADPVVDPAFGTGAVGVTPAHSMTDWDIAHRHDLPSKQVINEYARMTVGDERILDKKTTEARDVIVQWLRDENLLEKEEDTVQNIATAERTGGIVEPLPKLQWFIDVNKEVPGRGPDASVGAGKTLKEIMREPVADGRIAIIPDHEKKKYFHWIDNLRDWCISRQIWYGHRIPVWYRGDEIKVGDDPSSAEDSEGTWEQDEDTLDTWFSSGLWTFSTLGWPEKTDDLATYHPTDFLDTAYEILFFWVARMILMTGYALDDIPFRTVYLHGIVRDAQGRKMSKSLGNGIDPIEVAKKFGADAGRMALIVGTTPGTDSRISEDKIKAYKHFANKLWNIARFVLMTVPDEVFVHVKDAPSPMTDADKDILVKLGETTAVITKNLDTYNIHEPSNQIYHFIWHEFADKYVETAKVQIADSAMKESTECILAYVLKTSLKLLHPFMPFVTEELWGKLPIPGKKLLMIEEWPR